MDNILDEYLVKIGAQVDRNAFAGASKVLEVLTSKLDALNKLLKFGGVAAAFAALTEAIVGNIKTVAQLDLEYTKLAKDMWVTKETAKALKVTMGIMKVNENDIAWVPELREQFFRLRAEMTALATPQDADSQLSWIRSIGYDVQSLQLKMQMFREWLVYYLIKYLAPYIEQFKEFIEWLNQQFGENLQSSAKKVAYWLSRVVSLLASGGRFLGNIVETVYEFFEALPPKTRQMVTALTIAGALIMSGPFGMMLAAIGGGLLLLEDFFFFLDGKKSSKTLAPLWKTIMEMNTEGDMFSGIKEGLTGIIELLGNLVETVDLPGFLNASVEGADKLVKGVKDLGLAIDDLGKRLGLNMGSFNSFFSKIGRGVGLMIRSWAKLTGLIGELFSAVADAVNGDFAKAGIKAVAAIKNYAVDRINDARESFGGRRKLEVAPGTEDADLEKLNPRLKEAIEQVNKKYYDRFGKDLVATSGWRSAENNEAVNGSPTSHHLTGDAVDISTEDMTEEERQYFFEIAKDYGITEEDNSYHDRGSGMHFHGTTPPAGWNNDTYASAEAPSSVVPGTNNYNNGGNVSIGKIEINVASTNANPKEIGTAVGEDLEGRLAANGKGRAIV